MRNLKRILISILILLLLLGVLAFVLENQQSISLLFFGWAGPQLPVSMLIILALLIGMLIGPLLAWAFRRVRKVSRKHLIRTPEIER
ncbi:LapA family protein [Pseudomonas sp. N3-W]|uniref:LapA family protein n=1 Tax=Pseudomonas sp. N3-W TaxID=2975049 RepID=UPI00217D11DC|nr:LapA family protein [Pseudomonas sp. N3-W]UWF47689.1 LapA family protein [Pseudomonas sp. N3-W]